MQNFTTRTIREIALEMPLTTRIFEEYKIDFCCGGRIPFGEACLKAGVDPNVVRLKIENALESFPGAADSDFAERKSPSELIDYIIEKHHVFTRNEMLRLGALMDKVCNRHGDHRPELFELRDAFRLLCEDLTEHLRKEETVLFPFIKTLEMSAANNLSVPQPHFRTVRNPVRMMMTEHDAAGELLGKMREVSGGYALPEGACPSYTGLFFGFEDLERDLHRHIHLENNVLFPQALELEEKAFGDESGENPAAADYASSTACR